MNFARRVFLIAGIYGVISLLPQYFLETRIGQDHPPAITHPEYFYGFLGVALAWQVLFIILSRDPVRHRILMLPAVLEKFSFGIAGIILYFQNRVPTLLVGFAIIDTILGILFFISYQQTAAAEKELVSSSAHQRSAKK